MATDEGRAPRVLVTTKPFERDMKRLTAAIRRLPPEAPSALSCRTGVVRKT